ALLAALNYAARFAGSGNTSSNAHNDVYSYSGFAGGMIVYAIWMGAVLWIASGRPDLLALRLPRPSLPRVAGYAAAAVAAIFGLAHGLLEALLVLVPFGIALAWLRDRTTSVYPGMVVHGIFNGVALAAAVLT